MLIIDPICPKPYSPDLLSAEIMGGTEATVIRLMAAMPQASVMQHNREAAAPGYPQFRPLDWNALPSDGPIVVMRKAPIALQLRLMGWKGPLYLWLHDLIDLQTMLCMGDLAAQDVELIPVSYWHRDHVLAASRALFDDGRAMPRSNVIYNPYDERLTPRGPCDPDRLVFISSPHKGLRDALPLFAPLKQRWPSLELVIANPGNIDIVQPGVRALGNLTHDKAMDLLASAFCMFYPNMTYPETFGIVYAEANALGVPVLAHDFGSAAEVLGDPRQIVDARNPSAVVARFADWRQNGRPQVKGREVFKLAKIVEQWNSLAG